MQPHHVPPEEKCSCTWLWAVLLLLLTSTQATGSAGAVVEQLPLAAVGQHVAACLNKVRLHYCDFALASQHHKPSSLYAKSLSATGHTGDHTF